jgi:uncharacterized protein (DUF302 family)
VNILLDNPMTQFSLQWILSLNWLCQFWGQVQALASECLIFEVCQPHQAKKVLDQNMSVSTALPCRISIYEEGGKTILVTLKPTTLLALFNQPQLEGVAQEVEDTIVKIMKETASA